MNYTELKTAIGQWINRDDDATVAIIPTWISFFEERARRELRQWLTETVRYQAVNSDLDVNGTFEEVISAALADGVGGVYNAPLDIIDFAEYHRRMANDSSVRQPVTAVYLERDEQDNTYTMKFYPPISANSPISFLAVIGVGVLASLSVGNPSNRLLAVAPSLYLKGALIEGAEFLEHDERIPVWQKEVQDGFDALNLQQVRRQGGSPRPAPLPVVFG